MDPGALYPAPAPGLLSPPPTDNLDAAHQALGLTPQERALYERHLSNLYGPGGFTQPDGKRSSLYSSTVSFGDKTYIVPSVYDGRIVGPMEADARAMEYGLDKLPSYSSHEEANKRYQQLHDFMEKDTNAYEQLRR